MGPGGLFFVFSALEHQAEQAFSALRPEIPDKYVFLHIRRGAVLKEVDKEVRLHEDLVIHSVNVFIGVMMTDQIADPVNLILFKPDLFQNRLCFGRSVLLLQFSIALSAQDLCPVNSDIMNISGSLEDQLRLLIEAFAPQAP